jgi:hypothetical protein
MKKKNEFVTEKQPWKLCGVEFFYLCVLGIAVAMIGWIVENVFRVIDIGVIDSRYHLLPFISPYGLAVFALHLVSQSFWIPSLWESISAFSMNRPFIGAFSCFKREVPQKRYFFLVVTNF